MKVAMVDPSLFTGRYDDALCAALAGAGHQVTLHARPMRATDAIEPERYRYDPDFFGASERWRGLLGEGTLFRAIKAAEYVAKARLGNLDAVRGVDAVHVQWLPFPTADRILLGRLANGGNRPALVHTVHNASAFHGDGGAQGRGYRAQLDRFDALIVHGETTRSALLAQGIPADRLHVVPHPPMRLAQASPEDVSAVPSARMPRILFFGTIRPYKGFDLLIDACLKLWREGVAYELAVAGKPFMDIAPLLEKVRAEGFGDHLVTDLGFLKEGRLDAHLRTADIVVFPYRDIDSSGAFLSALHYGKAMVATKVGMFTELDGEKVRLVAPDNSDALVEALKQLLTDEALRDRLGQGAVELSANMGAWDTAANATAQVYEYALMKVGAA